jgi:hypothetical protein
VHLEMHVRGRSCGAFSICIAGRANRGVHCSRMHTKRKLATMKTRSPPTTSSSCKSLNRRAFSSPLWRPAAVAITDRSE